ncbi:MAG: ABC transporter ATP-binding protein [Nitrososphaerales archaeon]
MSEMLIQVKNLVKHFPVEKGIIFYLSSKIFKREEQVVHAVCDVSLDIKKGETLGLVGESGSGKSTLGKCIIRLIDPTSGKIIFDGTDISLLKRNELRKYRRKMQMIFQDPFSSLNPRISVGNMLKRMLELHEICEGKEALNRAKEILEMVGLSREHTNRYPHQFSGGQKQRIAIARAIAVNPDFIVADEPVSSLDVSIQAQILNLLMELKERFNLTYLFISHDLGVIKHISDRVAVMYLGKVVERGSTEDIFSNPSHPYTQALISSLPIPDPEAKRDRIILKGEVPSSLKPPEGCRFHPRCPYMMERCKKIEPKMIEVSKDHYVACHLYYEENEN